MFFLECWNNEPDHRPVMNQVVAKLNAIMKKTNILTEKEQVKAIQLSNEQQYNLINVNYFSRNDSLRQMNTIDSLREELSRVIQNFEQMNTEGIVETLSSNKQTVNKTIIIDDIVDLIFKEMNKGIEGKIVNQHILDYFIAVSN